MKRKTVIKIMVDLAMLVFFIAMVFAKTTGMVFHEVFGLVLGGLVLTYVALNASWFSGAIRGIRTRRRGNVRGKLALNLALVIMTLFIVITGVLMSVALFPNIDVGHRDILRAVHRFGTYATLALIGCHVLLHAKYLMGVLPRIAKNLSNAAVRQVLTASFVLVLVSLFAYNQLTPILAQKNATPAVTTTVIPTAIPSPTVTVNPPSANQKEQTVEPPTPTVEAATPAVSLDEFLSGLFCTGCGKHCPLISPRCGTGQAQAQSAEAEYAATYGAQ